MDIKNRPEVEVSIVVPVYNSEKYLRTCLDSLISQTIESFEIVAVNNGSTDGSGIILEQYAEKYPNKFYVFTIEHSNYVGTGRNYGISMSRGRYIFLCDSDDIVERNGVFFLYNRAKHYNCDIVYGRVNFVNTQSHSSFFLNADGEGKVSIDTLIKSGAEFWRRIYSKELLEKVGPMPEDTLFDDIAYLPVVHSYAKNARSTDRVVYNYFRRSDSTVGGISPAIIENSILSEKYAIEHCNPEYLDSVCYFIAKRIIGNMETRWVYRDKITEEIREFWKYFENSNSIKEDPKLYYQLKQYYEISDRLIPKIVYVPDFEETLTKDEINYIQEKAFDKCRIVVLNRGNCNLNGNKNIMKAYEEKRYDFVGQYFALEKINETGGFFLDRRIRIDKPLNALRLDASFFGFIDKTSYSEWIFGSVSGGKVLQDLLATYTKSGRYLDPFYPLSLRIKNIATVVYDIPLDGNTHSENHNITVYSPDVLVTNIFRCSEKATVMHICSHDFSGVCSDEYTTIKYSTLSLLSEKKLEVNSTINYAEINNLKSENQIISERLKNIEISGAYKLAIKFYNLSNKVKPLKWLGKKIVR